MSRRGSTAPSTSAASASAEWVVWSVLPATFGRLLVVTPTDTLADSLRKVAACALLFLTASGSGVLTDAVVDAMLVRTSTVATWTVRMAVAAAMTVACVLAAVWLEPPRFYQRADLAVSTAAHGNAPLYQEVHPTWSDRLRRAAVLLTFLLTAGVWRLLADLMFGPLMRNLTPTNVTVLLAVSLVCLLGTMQCIAHQVDVDLLEPTAPPAGTRSFGTVHPASCRREAFDF